MVVRTSIILKYLSCKQVVERFLKATLFVLTCEYMYMYSLSDKALFTCASHVSTNSVIFKIFQLTACRTFLVGCPFVPLKMLSGSGLDSFYFFSYFQIVLIGLCRES